MMLVLGLYGAILNLIRQFFFKLYDTSVLGIKEFH